MLVDRPRPGADTALEGALAADPDPPHELADPDPAHALADPEPPHTPADPELPLAPLEDAAGGSCGSAEALRLTPDTCSDDMVKPAASQFADQPCQIVTR